MSEDGTAYFAPIMVDSASQDTWVPIGLPVEGPDGSATYNLAPLVTAPMEESSEDMSKMPEPMDIDEIIGPENMEIDDFTYGASAGLAHMETDKSFSVAPPPAKRAKMDQHGGAGEPYIIHPDRPIFNMRRAHARHYHDVADEIFYSIEFTDVWRGRLLNEVWQELHDMFQ